MKTLVLFCCVCVFATSAYSQLTSDFVPPNGGAPTSPSESPGFFRLIGATSTDGVTFTSTGKIITDQAGVPDVVVDARGRLYLYYTGWTVGNQQNVTAAALSDDKGKTWFFKYVKFNGMPKPVDPDIILLPDGTFRMYATAEVSAGKAGIIYAESTDGITFVYKGVIASLASGNLIDSNTFLVDDTWHLYAISNTTVHYHYTSKDGKTFTAAGEMRFTASGSDYFVSNGYTTADGRYRMFASFLPEKHIRSFTTTDGTNWAFESGNRFTFVGASLEELYLKDPAITRLQDGTFFAAFVTRLTQSATVFAPLITSFSSASVGSSRQITITGSNFIGTTSVLVGGVPATSFTVLSATQIVAIVPGSASGAIAVLTAVGSATSTTAATPTSISTLSASPIGNIELYPHPPVADQMTARYSIAHRDDIRMTLVNALGNEVLSIIEGNSAAGTHEHSFSTAHLPQGTYFLRLQTPTFSQTKPVQVIR